MVNEERHVRHLPVVFVMPSLFQIVSLAGEVFISLLIYFLLPVCASSSLDCFLRLWDLESGKQIKAINAGPGK